MPDRLGALTGIRVLDFTRVLAGPFCTMMLADLGAEVVKVESPDGDETRQWGPPWLATAAELFSAYYLSVNRNKRSVTLDLKTRGGQRVARDLAMQSHVVVENFRVGQMAQFGLDAATLMADHTSLVYCSISGYGQTGVYATRAGYDAAIQAMSGLMSITGEPTGHPMKVGVAISDVITGLMACNAIQAALRHAEASGQGQRVDISLLESQLAGLVNVASSYLISGHDSARLGNAHPSIAPYQTFEASDAPFVLACGNDRQFIAVCTLAGYPEWAQDERFRTNPSRVAHRETLTRLLGTVFITRTASDWVNALLEVGVPSGLVQTVGQALDDPYLLERGLRQTLQVGDTPFDVIGSPLHLSKTPVQYTLPPPILGAHTDEVLRDWLRYDAQTIEHLRTENTFG